MQMLCLYVNDLKYVSLYYMHVSCVFYNCIVYYAYYITETIIYIGNTLIGALWF